MVQDGVESGDQVGGVHVEVAVALDDQAGKEVAQAAGAVVGQQVLVKGRPSADLPSTMWRDESRPQMSSHSA